MATSSKWTYETCYEEAKKYKTKSEFCFGNQSAYNVANRNKWLNDYDWFEKPKEKWTYKSCYKLASKCSSKSEFKKMNNTAYNVARKKGWLNDYTWIKEKQKPSGYWTRESCYNEAKKYTSKAIFRKMAYQAYDLSMKNGWFDDYTWFVDPRIKFTYDVCYTEAKKYNTKKDFFSKSRNAYNAARKNGWLNDYTWLKEKQKPSGYWNYETCYEEAKKYNSIAEFQDGNQYAYIFARKNGWDADYTWLKKLRFPMKYRFNLLKEFIDEYELRAFLENNDENILYIILRNVEPKYEPLVDEVEKIIRNSNGNDPMKALIDKYSQDETAENVNKDNETSNEAHEEIHGINDIDLDDDEAVKEVLKQEEEKKEVSIDDVVKNTEKELEVINKIEHLLTPEDREYIMDKFLNDKLREYMAKKDAQK